MLLPVQLSSRFRGESLYFTCTVGFCFCAVFAQTVSQSGSPADGSPLGCGLSSVRDRHRVFGGRNARPGEFPWIARIVERDSKSRLGCNAVLISDRYLLSTAHCFRDNESRQFSVYLGDYSADEADGEQEFVVERVIQHEQLNRKELLNDITLLKLEQSLETRLEPAGYGSINKICLPESPTVGYTVNEPVTLIGWGVNDSRTNLPADVIQCTEERIVERRVCERIHFPSFIRAGQLCAAGTASGQCSGDSGASLSRRRGRIHELVGLVSYSKKSSAHRCTEAGHPGIFTKVADYLNWIETSVSMAENSAAAAAEEELILEDQRPATEDSIEEREDPTQEYELERVDDDEDKGLSHLSEKNKTSLQDLLL